MFPPSPSGRDLLSSRRQLLLTGLAATEYLPYTGERLVGGGFLARALLLAQTGKVDGISGIWRTAEREQWLAFSDPIVNNELGLYALAERGPLLSQLADVKTHKLKVGVVRGYARPKDLLDLKPQLEETLNDVADLRASVVWQNVVVESTPLHMALRRDSPPHRQQLAAFNTGLAAITKEGSLAKLKQGYGLG